jgi:gluconokinase
MGITGEFVVMGVSGCGKSSVAEELAKATGGRFLDADDFHPPANKEKMAAGIPLCDEDRWGWLDVLNAELRASASAPSPLFLACSALRRVYRERLSAGLPSLRFLYLQGSKELIRSRMEARSGHFMPPALLDSQFSSLEEPTPEEAVVISIDQPVASIVKGLLERILSLLSPNPR